MVARDRIFPEFAADSSTATCMVQLRVNRLSLLADYHAAYDQVPDERPSFCPIFRSSDSYFAVAVPPVSFSKAAKASIRPKPSLTA
jgi:hypothetical protein